MSKNVIIETYYRENYKRLVKIARSRVGDYSLPLAEEAVQEAFARACKYYRTYDRGVPFDGWFKKILYNAINQLKSQERDGGAVYNEDEAEAHVPQVTVAFTKEVIDLLNQSKERDLEILNMYFFYGFKTREVSEVMNISHDVVRDVIRTFRKKLKT